MNRTSKFALLFAATIAAGCASTPAEQTASADQLVCSRETPLGSMMAVTKCKTRQQIEIERQEAERVKDSMRETSRTPPSGGTR